jgi:hypothetical protein
MPAMNVEKFERFFRLAASLDVDKGDLKRYNDFLDQKMHDLLARGAEAAMANGHDAIWPSDLPLTKGLQEDIKDFRAIDEEIELQPILDGLTKRPPFEVAYLDETEAELPEIAGGLSVALARSLRILEPGLKNPNYGHWDRSFRMFDLLI